MDQIVTIMIKGITVRMLTANDSLLKSIWISKDMSLFYIGSEFSSPENTYQISNFVKLSTYVHGYRNPELTLQISLKSGLSILLEFSSFSERAVWKRGLEYVIHLEKQKP